jgi:ARG and Rhodanese-Phosphatase-superfamily-associated Protein domain
MAPLPVLAGYLTRRLGEPLDIGTMYTPLAQVLRAHEWTGSRRPTATYPVAVDRHHGHSRELRDWDRPIGGSRLSRNTFMTPIATTIASLSLGQPKNTGRLTVFPLITSNDVAPPYLLLDEALQNGLATITEISESGSVPELRFENRAQKPVLIVDGEALVGAKQNRIVNITILVPAQSITFIPVSCVERGRWAYRRPDFSSSDHVLYSKSRAEKALHVSQSMRSSGRPESDQGAIWADIDAKALRMAAESPSDAMDAMFEKSRGDLEALEARLQPESNQVGAVFALDGRIVGLEVFDAAETWRRLSRKVYRSYALDALDAGSRVAASPLSVHEWLQMVAMAPVSQSPSIGLGQDARFDDARLSGGALVVDQSLIHCAAFDAAAWR